MKLFIAALIGLLAAVPLRAQEPQASEASIRELMALMQSEKLLDGMYAHLDSTMQASLKQALAGQTLNPQQRKIMDDMRAELVALLKAEMAWDKFEPELIEIYRKTFTEQEVVGMLGFYRSAPGQAVIAKMPAVMRASMDMAQGRIAALMPRLRQLQEDTAARLKAAPR